MKDRYTGNMICQEHLCHCKELGNGIHVKVNILSNNGVQMADLLFVLCFYTYGCRNGVKIRKDQLVVRNGEYYALLNEKYFADGWLACDVEILEQCAGWPHNLRPVTVRCNTSIAIGGCSEDYQIPCDCEYHNGEGVVNGYNITFQKVDKLPGDESGGEGTPIPQGELYYADEEDITLKKINSKNTFKFKDRYTSKGKGYIILRTEKTLTEQMTQENTIYEVRYDFDLGGGTLEIPANCVLDFIGGSFSNGTLKGNNTLIKGYDNAVFGEDLTIQGTYANDSAKTGWFKVSEGCIDVCQVISKHVEISDSRNYGIANLQDGCVLDVNGQDAVFSTINTYGEYVYIDLAGGSIGSTFGGGLVAETVTGGNTFTAQDGHSFYVGQRLHSSKDVGAKTVQFFGSANYPIDDPVLVTAVDGNTITMSKDLGEFTLHKGLGLGNTSWDRFIETYGKKVVIANGVIKNIYSYVCTNWSDGLVEFNHVDFLNLGLDSFHLSYYTTLSFNHCYISKPIDYAKTTIMLYQGSVLVDNCKIDGGNFDHFIGCYRGDYEGDDVVDRGIIRITNSSFDGTKYDEDASVQNNLHCFCIEKNGVFNEFTIDNCRFKGYARHIFSSSVLHGNYDTKFEKIRILNCEIDGLAMVYFDLNSFTYDSFEVRDCKFKNVSNHYLFHITPNSSIPIKYNNCSFENIAQYVRTIFHNHSIFRSCSFINTNIQRKGYKHEYHNCEFDNSWIAYGNEYNTNKITFDDIIRDCYFVNSIRAIQVSVNYISNVTVTKCVFRNCTNAIFFEGGTNVHTFRFTDNVVDGSTYVLNSKAWLMNTKISHVFTSNLGGFTTEMFTYGAGAPGSTFEISNCDGIEDIIYPATAATTSEGDEAVSESTE